MDKHRAFVVARWLAAGALGAWTARQFFVAGHAEIPATGALHGFYALAGLLGTVLCVAPELVRWAVLPFNRVIDAILLPGESGTPPADYTLARFYCQQMRYDEAYEEYLKIIHYHPRELAAYVEGMMTAGQAGRIDVAARFHRRGRRVFRNAEIRRRLQVAIEDSRLTAAAMAESPEMLAD